MKISKIDHDDFCDIFSKKICDNCGKCLEEDGIDIRAINIEDISKSVEENKFIEEELKRALETLENSADNSFSNVIAEDEYTINLDANLSDNDYIDAFDNIVYFDEIGLDEDDSLEELTDELYPGIRKLRINH